MDDAHAGGWVVIRLCQAAALRLRGEALVSLVAEPLLAAALATPGAPVSARPVLAGAGAVAVPGACGRHLASALEQER